MITKTYQAESMMQALKLVQEELGAEAIVLSVRQITASSGWQTKGKAGVEIVAMGSAQPEVKPSNAAQPALALRQSANHQGVEFVEEVPPIEWDEALTRTKQATPETDTSFKKEGKSSHGWQPRHLTHDDAIHTRQPEPAQPRVETRQLQTSPAPVEIPAPLTSPLDLIRARLLQQGIEEDFINWLAKISKEVLPAYAQADAQQCKTYISQQLSAELLTSPSQVSEPPSRIMVFTGISGSGKTSAIAKVAYFYSHVFQKKVAWVSADTVRMGAISEARSFTDAMGIPLYLVYSPDDLQAILESTTGCDLVLIDTPGINPYQETKMVDIGAILTEIPNRYTCLVVSATTKDDDLRQVAASMGLYGVKGLVLTKLDETLSYGNLYNLARNTRIPLLYFCSGKEVNNHLTNADSRQLVNAMLGKGWSQ